LELEVICSKGTYVRTLAEDIARALGTCGYVTRLHRVYVEPFMSEPMHTLESIAARAPRGVSGALAGGLWRRPPGRRCIWMRRARSACGRARRRGGRAASGRVRLYDESGRFFGMGERMDRAKCARGGCLSCSRTLPPQVEFRGCNGPKDQVSGLVNDLNQ
jgi:tRNA pseudouridine55 synthase